MLLVNLPEIDVSLEYKLNGTFNIVLFLFNLGGGKSDRLLYENIIAMFSFSRFCVMYSDSVMLIRLMDSFQSAHLVAKKI